VPALIVALPGIVEAVGSNVPVLLDGGVRRGVHVFKALALGARAVAVGRPTLYSLALGGAPGVKSMLDTLKTELQFTMKLAGCASIKDINRKFVT
jgi:L-lactate oxidase